MDIKRTVRFLLNFLHIDLTKNLKYDRLTNKLFKMHLSTNSNCIDVGCHKGEIMDVILKLSPNGHHFGFEPLPHLYEQLKNKYKNKVQIYPYALASKEGETSFHYVKNAPAYSGIKKREYDIPNPDIEKIEVTTKPLDRLIPESLKISCIKIDVEGGEFEVLKGAKRILSKDKPKLIFEFGSAGSTSYGTKPEAFYQFLTQYGYNIYDLSAACKNGNPYYEHQFVENFYHGHEYYFFAS